MSMAGICAACAAHARSQTAAGMGSIAVLDVQTMGLVIGKRARRQHRLAKKRVKARLAELRAEAEAEGRTFRKPSKRKIRKMVRKKRRAIRRYEAKQRRSRRQARRQNRRLRRERRRSGAGASTAVSEINQTAEAAENGTLQLPGDGYTEVSALTGPGGLPAWALPVGAAVLLGGLVWYKKRQSAARGRR